MSGAHYSAEVTTLGQAWREFARKPSPWLIGLAFAIVLVLRVVAGGEVTWRDGVAVAAMLVIYPFGEWAIHVYLLHMRPAEVGDRKIDLPVAKAHRAHHRKPNDLTMILLGPRALALLSSPSRCVVARRRAHRRPGLRHRPIGAAAQRRARRICGDRRLRMDALPHPHRLPAALPLLPGDLAEPPPSPLQERALLARHHEHRERSRARDEPGPAFG